MANTYPNSTHLLSRLKIGDVVYFLKDADVRTIIDGYGDIVTANKANSVINDATTIPTNKAVYDYVESQITDLASALVFRGVSTTDPGANEGTGTVTISGTILTPSKGDVVIYSTKEFVYDGTKWIELGDEGIYLTQATAEADYVKKTFTIAGITMQDNITADELKSVLGISNLGALAYADTATQILSDYATGINGASYTPEGDIQVALGYSSVSMNASGSYKPAGTVSIEQVTTKFVAGTTPSVDEKKKKFATAGMTVAISTSESEPETLVFADAVTEDALTATGFLAGTLPTLSTESATGTPILTGLGNATFNGTEATIGVSGNYDKAVIDTTEANKPKFTGKAATITPTLATGNKTITVTPVTTPNT